MDNCFLVSFAGFPFPLAHNVGVTQGSVLGPLLSFVYITSLEISPSTMVLNINYVITPRRVYAQPDPSPAPDSQTQMPPQQST